MEASLIGLLITTWYLLGIYLLVVIDNYTGKERNIYYYLVFPIVMPYLLIVAIFYGIIVFHGDSSV